HLHLSLLTPSGHPLTKKKHVRPQDLVTYPLIIMPEQNHSRRILNQLFRRHDLTDKLNIVMEAALTDVICKYVAARLGISVIHMEEDPAGFPPELCFRVFDTDHDVPITMIVRKGGHLPEAAREFERTVRRILPGGTRPRWQ